MDIMEMSVASYNSRKGYDYGWCQYCKGKGYIAKIVMVKGQRYVIMEECCCYEHRQKAS